MPGSVAASVSALRGASGDGLRRERSIHDARRLPALAWKEKTRCRLIMRAGGGARAGSPRSNAAWDPNTACGAGRSGGGARRRLPAAWLPLVTQPPLNTWGRHGSMAFHGSLLFRPGFLAPEEMRRLFGNVQQLEYLHDTFRGQATKRASACFGRVYVAAGRQLKPAAGFPDWLLALVERALPYCPADAHFEQCIISRYPPGAGIGWHMDAHYFGDSILGICVGGDGRLRFRPLGSRSATAEVTTTSGSLYVMQEAARWEYEHDVVPVQDERYSLTFRGLPRSFLTPPSLADPIPGLWIEQDAVTADQATVQEYDPGAGISDHVDDRLAFKGTSRLFPCFRRARTGWCCPRSASCG